MRDFWTETVLIIAVLLTGVALGLFIAWQLWGDPYDRCIASNKIPEESCEMLFKGAPDG